MPSVDCNGFVHDGRNEVFIFNDENVLIRKKRKYQARLSKLPRPILSRKADLDKLENAIFNHPGGEYRRKYLQMLSKPETRKLILKKCWEELNWRPRACGRSVWKKNPDNVYTKNK